MNPGRRKLISIVTPCYNEEENVEDCYEAVRRVFAEALPGYDHEHLFCDNCSTDATVGLLRSLAARDPRVRVILNARNFGPFNSNYNGLLSTRGDAVLVFLPADLQDPPELIPEFVARWEEGFEVVQGVRTVRDENPVVRGLRRLYYRTVSRLASIEIPNDVGEFQLVDRAVVEALRGYDDYYPYIRGMIAHCGFRRTGIAFGMRSRKKGISKNRMLAMIDQGLNGLISFTKLPMRICMMVGLGTAAASLLYALAALVVNLIYFRQLAPPGIPTLIVALFVFSGLQLFFFGVLGEYIAAIHFQVRKRPLVIERERINFDSDAPPREAVRPPLSAFGQVPADRGHQPHAGPESSTAMGDGLRSAG